MKKTGKTISKCAVVVVVVLMYTLYATTAKIDDWQYGPQRPPPEESSTFVLALNPSSGTPSTKLGLAAGGAKDIGNFRENIENNYLPLSTDMTYEGLFYCYYFDTGEKEDCSQVFCPSYSYAITRDPFSHKKEYYLTVGLNSGIKARDFKRKNLNLVIVLDISDSMNGFFDKYYYDEDGNRMESDDGEKSKIDIACRSLVYLFDHLTDTDRLGIILFNQQGYLAKPLRSVGKTDMEAIKKHILEIRASDGTCLSAGMEMGTDLFDEFKNIDQNEYENRIIFLTDAMPNLGETDEEDLLNLLRKNADNHIYTTFIGVGVDFNTELVEYITKIRGANYYSVHSSKEFKKRMDEEFEYMVTPLVFDLELKVETTGFEIEKVYGSPEADEATGELMKVSTLFPSPKKEGETKGGVILLKLKKKSSDGHLKLKVSYEDRNGVSYTSEKEVVLTEKDAEFFENTGIRKAVLLVRYANLVNHWISDERKSYVTGTPVEPSITAEEGITVWEPELSEWERKSVPLQISQHYKELFQIFREYFAQEMGAIRDETLEQELTLMDVLISYRYTGCYRL